MNVKYYADASNMKLEVSNNSIDVAFRSLSANDIADLRTNDKVKVVDGPGGEIRYMVFNFNTMPFGAKTSDADPAKALAVRQAVADLVDRKRAVRAGLQGHLHPALLPGPEGPDRRERARTRRSTATATAPRAPTRPSRRWPPPASAPRSTSSCSTTPTTTARGRPTSTA